MSKLVSLEGLSNTRDLGGMKTADGRRIREGFLYRSGQLYRATDADRAKLDTLNIGKVLDFRSVPERDEMPDPVIAGAQNIHLPIIQDIREGITRGAEGNQRMVDLVMGGSIDKDYIDRHMQGMYAEFVTEVFAHKQYARFLNEVYSCVQQGKAALWHCTAGKDRAGFATVVMLEVLGVARDDIMADYLKTNEYLIKSVDALMESVAEKLPDGVAVDTLRRFLCADESYLQAAYDAADEQFGSFELYLEQALHIDPQNREQMRMMIL